jgi:type IV pilus assembly protein PilM
VSARFAIGLDIGTSSVRAAEVAFGGKGQLTLRKFGQVALPPDAVRDGEVVQPDVVAKALRELWAATKFSSKQVALGVANQKVVVRQVELPWLPADELRRSLPYQVQDFLPIPVDRALLDFFSLEEHTSADGVRTVRGLLVAASREMVLTTLAALTKAGLRTTTVDLSSFAVLRTFATVNAASDSADLEDEVEALVDIGARVTNIVVHRGGVPSFVRILLMGGKDVTDAVAERMGISQDQAESLKQRLGVHSGTDLEPGDLVALRALEAAAEAFVEEIRGSLAYYSASQGAAPVARVIVSGGGVRLAGLVERLGAATRLPVAAGNPLAALTLGRTGLTPEQIAYVEPLSAVPVGLALGAQ